MDIVKKKIREYVYFDMDLGILKSDNDRVGDELEEVIDKKLQGYTFTRTPKKVKLSNIIEDLCHIGLTLIYDNNVITIKEADTNNEIVNINVFNNKIDVFDWVMFDSNNSFTNHYYYSYFDNIKWLYRYWVDGTIIEVDE